MFDLTSLFKYLLEGLAVALAAYFIPRRTSSLQEVAAIALTAAATFAVLDAFAPAVAGGARQGTGFATGRQLVGGGATNAPMAGQLTESNDTESTGSSL